MIMCMYRGAGNRTILADLLINKLYYNIQKNVKYNRLAKRQMQNQTNDK